MNNTITTYLTLWNIVDIDTKNPNLKEIATLFLSAMNDWPQIEQGNIPGFVEELKDYFGQPLTIDKISSLKFDGKNPWHIEAGSSIVEMIAASTTLFNQSDFDTIVRNILGYYEQEFRKVDFIAELSYLPAEKGGRKTPAKTGYRPQLKFAFTDMQTSGQQTFIGKDTAFPGEKIEAKIKMASPDYFSERLTDGMSFEFREGAIVIGTGIIKRILNDRLEKASG